MFTAMWERGLLSTLYRDFSTAHHVDTAFRESVLSTFSIDRRKLIAGLLLLVILAVMRATLPDLLL
jgi:hypothetical protein